LAGLLLFGSLAAIAWKRAHALGTSRPVGAHWWRYAAGGGFLLGVTVVFANLAGDDMPEGSWALFMGALLTSVILLAVGLVMGITHAVSRRRPA
jgi:hypothetical protein